MGAMLDAPWNGMVFTPPTSIDIATIEDAIVNQLRSQINSIEIAHYPDRPESWRLTHRVGAALVMYKSAQYGDLVDTAAIIQERKLEFEIAIMVRDLGWAVGGDPSGPSPGAYAIIESIRTALTGYRIAGCRKMYPVREKFVKRDKQGGVWTYASTFALSTVAVEASQPEGVPALHQGHRAGRRRRDFHHGRRGGVHVRLEPAGSASPGQCVCREHHGSRRRSADPGHGFFARSRGRNRDGDPGRCNFRRRDGADRILIRRRGYCNNGPERADRD